MRSSPKTLFVAPEGLQGFCSKHNLTPGTFFHVAWALIGHVHSDSNIVELAYLLQTRTNGDYDVSLRDLGAGSEPVSIGSLFQRAAPHAVLDSDAGDTLPFSSCQSRFFIASPALGFPSAESKHQEATQPYFILVLNDEAPFRAVIEASDQKEAEVVLSRFRILCHQLLSSSLDLDLKIDQLEYLTPDETEKLTRWNGTLQVDRDECIHEIVSSHARSRPNDLAVCAWDGNLSFLHLDLYSSTVAAHLIAQGWGQGTYILSKMAKSRWSIVAMLAIAKAGAVFVPMDPRAPADRVFAVVKEVSAPCIITNMDKETLPDFGGTTHVLTNLTEVAINAVEGLAPLPEVSSTSLATAFFTSGSTGVPKGVLHDHRAICNGIRDVLAPFHINQRSRCLQFASPAFDVTMSETLTVLYAGGCVCIPNGQQVLDDINDSMARLQVTHAFLTPTVAAQVEPATVPSLQYLILGGEPLRKTEVTHLSPQLNLINSYGGTEMGIWETSTSSLTHLSDPRNVGHTVGAKIWIVHPHNHDILLPAGVPGEVLVESVALARGYYRPVDRRAFVDEPKWRGRFQCQGKARFYLSGDLGQYTPDGSLILLGRKDTQVKLRGHRIELGEVEYHLRRALPLNESVVEVVPDLASSKGSDTLVAFVVFPEQKESTAGQLQPEQIHLASQARMQAVTELSLALPAYMIPAVFIPISSVPLTVSRKTDRRKLRSIAASMSSDQLAALRGAQENTEEVQTEGEKQMQSVWAATLGIDRQLIGRNTHFFQLGADSIAAMKTAAAARSAGLAVGLSDFLRFPVLADLAAVATNAKQGGEALDVAPFSLVPSDAALELRQEAAQQCGVASTDIQDLYPCTPLQEGLMSLSARGGSSQAYLTRKVFSLPSDINVTQFEEAWSRTADAHPILRTRLVNFEDHGMMQAVVRGPLSWKFGTSLDEYSAQDEKHAMGFGSALSRYALIEGEAGNGQKKLVFVWTIHHSVYDGWSMPIIQDTLQRAYLGQSIESSPHFGNFIKYAKAIDVEASGAFWSSYLENPDLSFFPAVSPSSNSRPDAVIVQEFPWAWNPVHGINGSTVLQAAWAVTAGTYAGSRDVIFGTTLSGRNAPVPVPGLDMMTGPTIATVPVRVRWEPGTTVLSLLETVHRHATEMRSFEQTGLQNIARVSQDAKGACQFSCLFLVQPPSNAREDEIGQVFGVEDREKSTEFDDHPLSIECEVGRGQLRVVASFDSRVLDREQLQRVVVLFQQNALALSSSLQSAMSTLQLVPETDRRQIQEWNAGQPVVVRKQAHDLVRQQATQRPKHTAVSSWDGNMTYAQLQDASDRLANHLRSVGVSPGVMVPICFEKSLWAVVAMLGVLKAGGAFAVIEPSHPVDRKTVIIQQLGAKVAVVGTSTASSFPSECITTAVTCDSSIMKLPLPETPLPQGSPDDAMYVIFTSGSTGTPKGCVTEHQAFCSSMYAFRRASGLGSDDQVLQFASYSFDTSIEEMFCTLFVGATLHVPSEEARMNNLAGEIRRTKTSWIELSPKVASLLVPEEVPTLKTVILGGDRTHGSDVSRWPESTRLLNSYGCTEASVTSTLVPLNIRGKEEPPIGKGVGCNLWIVDPNDHNKLVPIGAPGELIIEGPGLGREYLGDADRTAKVFIFDPAWTLDGSPKPDRRRRFYKTGDIVRYNSEGIVFYLGRKDTQIKLRGQRVELGEIEHQLSKALPDCRVSAEIVMMQANSTAPDTLAAFFVFPDAPSQSAEVAACLDTATVEKLAKLRPRIIADLSRSLPAYMVPAIFIPINRIPLTISAKADRRKLRALAQALRPEDVTLLQGQQDVKEQPRTETEVKLQAAWAGVLGVAPETIGLDDHFFRIGGDSISAMKLVSAVRQLGLHTSVADIFGAPILRDLARQGVHVGDEVIAEDIAPFSLLTQGAKETTLREVAKQCGVRPEDIEDLYPCTALQEGLMALSAKHHGSYVTRQVFVLSGDIHMSDFHRAWEQVVQAHPILRTRIVTVDSSTLLQAVTTRHPSWETSIDLDQYIERDTKRGVEFGAPLSRYAIIPYYDRFFFVWTLHHSVFDGWSLPLVLRDLVLAYKQGSLSKETTRPGFNAFIKHLGSLDTTAANAFWSSYLEGPSTAFPAPLPVGQTAEPDATVVDDTDFAVTAVDGITPSTLLRAAWALLTRSYTGASDVLFGVTVNGRNSAVPGIEHMSGPTIATVPIRVRWGTAGGATTVRALLELIQQESTDMIPFEQTGLQHISRLNEDAQAACQFGTLFVVQQADDEEEDEGVSSIMQLYDASEENSAQFTTQALLVECTLRAADKTVSIRMSYDSKLLESSFTTSMARQFKHILSQLVDASILDQPITALDMVNPLDREQMEQWNEGKINVVNKTMQGLVSAAAAAQAGRQAISAWDGDMTYAELEATASRVAGRLRSLGIGTSGEGDVVLLCFEKSRWAIVSMLAILKAGAAFVALDPAQPDERLATIMTLSKARLILTSERLEGRLTSISKDTPNVVCTAQLAGGSASGSNVPLARRHRASSSDALLKDVRTCPDDLAYVIFTSGSTGVPKGVMITHRAAASSIMAHAAAFGVDSSNRTLQFSSFTFDACIYEIFTTLATGGCICMPSDSQRVNDLSGTINSMSINTVMLTPSVLALLAPESMPSLRTVIFIAEQVTDNDIQRWSGQCRILNGYGPTECTVVCVVNSDLRQGGCIGHAVGCRAWVVDPDDVNKLVPIGSAGELLIEGPSLARGYLNDPERTRSSFIYNPFWALVTTTDPSPSRRFYKTGDLVRQTSNGSFMYLGRKDTQVKLRGQRIELGEIDFHLRRALPSATVRSDIVQLLQQQQKTSSSSDSPATLTALAAFIVLPGVESGLENGTSLNAASLKRLGEAITHAVSELSRALPPYMVPSVFIPISAMPLTVSGKTDRQRLKAIAARISHKDLDMLRALQRGAGSGTAAKLAPRNDKEKRMQSAWATVLQLDPDSIGTNDSFFRLGGDSISAMKLVTVARALGLSVTMADIFRSPVLAALCRSKGPGSDEADAVSPFSLLPVYDKLMHQEAARQCRVLPEELEDLYPCTPLQQGLISLSIKEEGSYIVREIFRLGNVRIGHFKRAWEYVAKIHPILRTRLVHMDTYGTLQAVLNMKQAIEWRTSSSLQQYLEQDMKEGMGLGTPLSRYGLIQPDSDDGDVLFVWTAHHALYDGWSLPIIKEAVATAYTNVMIPETPTFSTFIRYILNMDAEAAASFWQSYLEGACASPFPAISHATLPEYQANKAEEIVVPWNWQPRDDITVATLLRTAYSLVVGSHTGSRDVVFGTTLSGRNAPVPHIEIITGPTIATVPVRVSWDVATTAQELLQNVQRQATEMIPYEQTGLLNIAKASEAAKSSCQVQSLFVVQTEGKDESAACASLFGEQLDLASAGVSPDQGASSPQTYPLGIEVSVRDDGLHLSATFDSRAVDPTQARRILSQLGHAAFLLSQHPDMPVSALDLVGPVDVAQIQDWNAQGPLAGVREAVYELIDRHAAERPGAMAVSAWDGDLTYAEFAGLSNGLAHRLRATGVGVGAETVVPFSYQKSKWVPVIMVAILKAGGAFVALDASQPASRLKFIVEQVGATILVTSPALAHHSSFASLPLEPFYPDLPVYKPEEQACAPPPAHDVPAADSLAYVVFTSGSTGVPKGVMVSHSATASSTLAHGPAMGISSDSRVLQFSSYTFDASVLEVLGSLLAGACVCIPSHEECSEDLNAAVRKYGINFVALTPRVASLLSPKEVPSIKAVALGAEVVTSTDIQRWEGRHVSNGYGPTECTVVCVLESSDHKPGRIGRGVGCRCWIADPEDPNKLAPVGAPGELLIEGPGLARGYLHQDELTAASFVYDLTWTKNIPVAKSKCGPKRFYKTGDLVRYDSDGGILFIGRKDTQVKLRGQRVELSEVEHHLRRLLPDHQVVADVVTFSQQKKSDSAALVAFIVPPDSKEDASRSRVSSAGAVLPLGSEPVRELSSVWVKVAADMAKAVPSYMVPSMYIPLDAIPLTTSSKTDRHRLQAIVGGITPDKLQVLRGTQSIKEPPRTRMEKLMHAAWVQILGLEPDNIGIRDSFFRLGGDSISAMRLVRAVADMGAANLRVLDLFRTPVLADLCVLLQREQQGQQKQQQELSSSSSSSTSSADEWSDLGRSSGDLTPDDAEESDDAVLGCLLPEGVDTPNETDMESTLSSGGSKYSVVPATDFQALSFEFAHLRHRGFVSYFVFRFFEPVSHERIRFACTQLVKHHSILRTKLKFSNGRLWQLVAPASAAHPSFVLLHVAADELTNFTTHLIEMDEARRLSPGEDFTKFFIINSPPGAQLVMRLAHTHYDGLSFPSLLQTLSLALRGRELPPPSMSFCELTRAMEALPSRPSINHWRRLLRDSRMTPVIAPAAVTANDGVEGLLARLIPLPNISKASITMATLVKAAWAVVLAQHSHLSDVVFGSLVSGRMVPVPGADTVVGPSVNITLVRANVGDGTAGTRAFLQAMHKQHTKSMEHEHIGFRRVIASATSWPPRTSFAGASIVQHQNIPLAAELNQVLPDLPFELNAKGRTGNAAAVWIITTARPAERLLSVDFSYALRAIAPSVAEALLQALCVAIEHFGRHWDADVPLPNTLGQVEAENAIPLLPCGGGSADDKVTTSIQAGANGASRSERLVGRAWDVLRKAHAAAVAPGEDKTISIFDVCGDNLIAVELRGIYEDLGVYLDLEQLLQSPRMEAQIALLTSLGY